MKITKERKLYTNEVINKLKFLELTDWQKRKLYEYEIPFDCVVYERIERKGSILWRLTYPFFFLYMIFVSIILMPMRFVIKGSQYFDKNGKINKIYEYWKEKIGV